jgi:fumarate reductase flavoprotein subunit
MTQTMTEEGLVLGMGLPEGAQGNKMPGLESELRALVDKGLIKISHSWDEIAEWIGADPKVLKATIDEYNTACDQGYDPIFVKDRRYLTPLRTAPYYAIKCHADFMNTIGGIKINEHMEVLDKRDNPIPGLYSAGVDTGGWQSDTYCAVLSGSAFGFAINSGRISGENASKFVSAK